MSFARAFSTRGRKPELEISNPLRIGRAATHRGGKPVFRHEISSPVALLSTTNATAHMHADIPGTSPIEYHNQPSLPASSASSIHSSSGRSDASSGSSHSNGTITDASSVDEAPSPCEPNHLSCYFKPAVETNSPTPSRSPSTSARQSFDMNAPNLPQRAPSHSKKAHEMVSRQRSMVRMQSPPATARGLGRGSIEAFSPTRTGFVEAPKESPFDNELAQLDEVAEEYGQVVSNHNMNEDALCMESQGLAHFGAGEYMDEIASIMDYFFTEENNTAGWI